MFGWWTRKASRQSSKSGGAHAAQGLRARYHAFRDLLTLNNECLELMAGLQEDLQFVTPRRDVLEARVTAIFEKAEAIVASLERLTGMRHEPLTTAVRDQRHEVERYLAVCQELVTPRLAASLVEVNADAASEAGGKASALGEVKNRVGLPVPDGYVLTTEAYRQFCGTPLWESIRDAVHGVDLNDLDALRLISSKLKAMVLALPVPRAVEVAVTERALALDRSRSGLAVRSSAVGEGGAKTCAGQFLSLINVPRDQVVAAYKQVVAERFSERALFYRLSTGLLEVDSPMAVLVLPVINARASGIMYTRDPSDPKGKCLWITATRGLGLDIASGRMPADLFIMSRARHPEVLERSIVAKQEELVVQAGGGITTRSILAESAGQPSLRVDDLRALVAYGIRLEEHFKCPQDIEWAQDQDGRIWILQSRPLALVSDVERAPGRSKVREEPLRAGGRTIYPGRVSGQAYLVEDLQALNKTPQGAVVFIRRASPEMVQVLPRVAGLVAEWGNVAGHAAALLREFKVPSVFQMAEVMEAVEPGAPVSLDAVQRKVYRGALWPPRMAGVTLGERYAERRGDPISRRLLSLNLLDPAASNFRPSGCKSTHDVLRFCHEKGVEAMFAVGDVELEHDEHCSRKLVTELPVNLYVLDLGGGIVADGAVHAKVAPEQILSRPFRGLWRGISHPAVSWTREMPASLSDLASVMASSLTPQSGAMRELGERSYLLVADEYMNLNSRLAYHFSLVDACLTDVPSKNYISFRFEGGGATRTRRSLRACLIEACLAHYGFHADRRGDLVNAWFKKGSAAETEEKLDILGRLMACTSQLDMYMTSHEVMRWYVRQFIEGNYAFRVPSEEQAQGPAP